MVYRAFDQSQKKNTDRLLDIKVYNLWPITAVASTSNGRSQWSQALFDRSSQVSSVYRCVYEDTRKTQLHMSWAAPFVPYFPDSKVRQGNPRDFCMHGRDLAGDHPGYFVKRTRNNTHAQQIYAGTNWQTSKTGSCSNPQQTVLRVYFTFCSVTSLHMYLFCDYDQQH